MSELTRHPIDLIVGARLRLSRSQAGLAQRELAEAIGITFQQLQKYEKGVDRISASKLYAAARVLRRSMNWFFEDADLVAADNGDLARLINDFLAKPEAFELASTFRGLPLEKQKIVVRLIGSFAIPTTGRGAD